MDRTALVLYLENVRDLEILKKRIEDLWNQELYRYQKDLNDFPTKLVKPTIESENLKLENSFYIWIMIAFISLIPFLAMSSGTGLAAEAGSFLFGISLFISVIASIFCFIGAVSDREERKKTNEYKKLEFQDNVVTVQANKNYIQKRKIEWNQVDTYYKNQYSKADAILNRFYDMNIIPQQFRGASGACYLYDYMSSSGESFQLALISNQIEESIKRIEARLDSISRQLSQVLYQQRVIREENRDEINRRITHDKNMINTLNKMEKNQRNIEEYSRLSANYNEAAALFSLATYLKY